MPEWTWADRVRKVRRTEKLGQIEFGERLGVSAATVAAWEASLNEPRNAVTVAKRIEVAFGVPATWMLGLTTGEYPTPPHPEGEPVRGRPEFPGVTAGDGSMATGWYPYSAVA